ncbi:MAG: M14-type cytosolic carboxypeptidase [Saprospiraceae bacterium]
MKWIHTFSKLLLLICIISLNQAVAQKKWEGQGPINVVKTNTLPIQRQYVSTFDLGEGIYASNDFTGARLNGIVLSGDTLITALITSENTPINPSPWYAFKLWSTQKRDVQLKLTYQSGAFHRYHPKISSDGLNWERLDESRLELGQVDTSRFRPLAQEVTLSLSIGPDTLWLSAQELKTSSHNAAWIDDLDDKRYVSALEIGKSREGRSIQALKIGKSNDKKMIFVLSRQHPPEVTGYLAMQSFVEQIAGDSKTAKAFRRKFNTYVVPMANPDGVDNGHWRHNTGGIDLNRDWANRNQPEVAAIQQFMKNKVAEKDGKFYFGVDFHSTWEDIYYTVDPTLDGNSPGLVPKMIEQMAAEIPGLDPNIRPGKPGPMITSYRFLFFEMGAEALTYEIGDDTPRDLLQQKGAVSAQKLMELLLERE